VPDIAEQLADIQRRIAALESAPRSNFTTIRGGNTSWKAGISDPAAVAISADITGADVAIYLSDNAENRGYLGTIATGTAVAVYLDNPDKSHRVFSYVSTSGLLGPYGTGPWTKNPSQTINSLGNPTTTSGTSQVGWRTLLYVTSADFELQYYVDLGGATSAEISVTADAYVADRTSGTPNSSQTLFTRTVSSTGAYTNAGSIPNTLWTPAANPVGSLLRLEFKARVSGGAGTISWAPTLPISLR
jgi:hypothetical protein